jgi:hypothetical protein
MSKRKLEWSYWLNPIGSGIGSSRPSYKPEMIITDKQRGEYRRLETEYNYLTEELEQARFNEYGLKYIENVLHRIEIVKNKLKKLIRRDYILHGAKLTSGTGVHKGTKGGNIFSDFLQKYIKLLFSHPVVKKSGRGLKCNKKMASGHKCARLKASCRYHT